MLTLHKMKNVLITGGCGFIGSHVIRELLLNFNDFKIYNVDALTYAGNLENLTDIEKHDNYIFLKGDITDVEFINEIFTNHKFQYVIHLAAESHVDRSILDPTSFAKTNILGTINLLNAFKQIWEKENWKDSRFYHVSTDEVYGSLGNDGFFTESTSYSPNSPYSASKASSDHFVRAFGETFNLPYVISNCSNNYGPNQFPEKLIPLFINNILENKNLPIYGDGNYTRDWLYVVDHAKAITKILLFGKNKETYNIGGFNEWKNIELVNELCNQMDTKLGKPIGTSNKLITFIKNRPGHDFRYAIDATKINKELNWRPSVTFEQGLSITIDWYINNRNWLQNVINGEYQNYYNKIYTTQI
jgi:dTDP-glucose 4,6-dehydratase